MYGYDSRTSGQANRNMIQVAHPPLQDTRPKTTHITSSLSRNFPLHKSAYYKSYKYNVLSNNGRLHNGGNGNSGGQKGGQCGQRSGITQSAPNFNNISMREQVSFPVWTKPFRPKQSTAYSGGRKLVQSRQPSHFVVHSKSPARLSTKGQQKEDLPPIVNTRCPAAETTPLSPAATPPPIRVTFNYINRRNSETPTTEETSESKDPAEQLTLARYNEFLRRVGHADLTHNSYVKVENWLSALEKDGTWPVQWFSSKTKR
ncbi:uncharacterized protein LOC134823523 isoform X2 [Bolinopsis microptera]|uniref:uncharacterized protein LOC134823523 isoform X2 n=1 Tax=Bolinopsis microptera TaxID=2820187 RepID=UPI00307AB4C0